MPSALAVFACRPNSHPFQERHVYLDEPVKIGRSVARCRPAQNNATFDCKVLSRNHALVWFDQKTGKFYLQDTKSSNGTFINSQRLSRGSEESPPCELLSGDIIQFGVDVTENTRKVTHGCIVSAIKLFLPDGMEARRRSDVIQTPLPIPVDKVAANSPSVYSQELFQLSQYLQEALHREQMLEQKLATLQRLLTSTQEASESSWQALIDEDRLLSRLEVMGCQLQAYSKAQTEEGLRKELLALQEDKHNYETTAKESLRRVLQEKIEVVRKLSEVERSLSNTEDECTHLKEATERSQDELKELADKYNAAVEEIRELNHKIKAAEGRQEELTQRGATEKKELELKIEELEEKEQLLQARIEALQADKDFTNQRLSALQVRMEQLQEKNSKDNNSLDTVPPGDHAVEVEERQEDKDDMDDMDDMDDSAGDSSDNCHVNNSGGESPKIQQLIQCPSAVKAIKENVVSAKQKRTSFDDMLDAHLQNNQRTEEDPDPGRVNQMEARESDMSDTLSPSRDRSSDDTSDGNEDEEELNQRQNRVSLHQEDLHPSPLVSGEPEQIIHHLHRELLEAQDLANNGKHKCLELQVLLEEERQSNCRLTEESTNQIQYLQSQLLKLQSDLESLREQREISICSTREELDSAQDEILVLRHAMESAANEREREISTLQADLGGVRSELELWRSKASKYEEEISLLQEAFIQQQEEQKTANQLQAQCEVLQQKCVCLQQDCDGLREERGILLDRLKQLEAELSRSKEQSLVLSSSLQSLEKREEVLQDKLGSLENQHLQDASRLKNQLDQAQARTHSLQKECEDTQSQLQNLRQRYHRTEQEKVNIHQELQECRRNLEFMQENKKNSPSILQPVQTMIMGLVLVLLYWFLSQLW
ncbi:sarcolemma associated protein a isoform X1 [Cynoglossus semilaevis]|uniref:sarcolemma associated protein a isoform X1 n=1 Tax=Cynoglossus semilaevis TaxID=244447 RepID=UPI0004955C7D|nr:sarcolemmal membrane-associated protein isoform X1 [Cynoglossus semilaevis]